MLDFQREAYLNYIKMFKDSNMYKEAPYLYWWVDVWEGVLSENN